MRTLALFISIVLAALSALLVACDRSTPSTGTTTANASPDGAPRLAVLSPALAQTLRDLGAGDRIVARHGWDSFTPATIPPVGNEGGIDYESLLKAHPTQVIMEAGAKEPPARLGELAASNNWTIVRVPNLKLDDIASGTTTLGAATGIPSTQAEELRQHFADAFKGDPDIAQRAGRVLVLIGVDPPALVGPGSFHHEMIERLGADAVPDSGAPFIQWSVEDVLKCDPDTIVLLAPGSTSQDPRSNLGPLAKINLRCLNRGAVIVVTDPKAHLPATSLAGIASDLRKRLTVLPPLASGGKP